MNLYFLDTKIKYTLQNNNFYAYSIINTTLLSTPLDSMERGNIFEELNKKYTSVNKNVELEKLRDNNHIKYNNLDIDFIKKVDKRYLSKASQILNLYNSIDSYNLLRENINMAIKNAKLIKKISDDINDLKREISKDLMSVIDYVDRKEESINVSKISKDNPLGISIINKYHSLKIFSSNMDLDDLNFEMQHQAKRLIYIKELEVLVKDYRNSKTIYNKENTLLMINNLYKIISEYIYLLTDSEFCYTKEAIKKILSYDYDFIDNYMPTYIIIMNKIWHYEIENSSESRYFYVICDINLKDNRVFIINNYNKKYYPDSGYICMPPKEIFNVDKTKKDDVLNILMPWEIKEKYELHLDYNIEDLNIIKIYTKKNNLEFSESLPIMFLGGD